MVCSGHSRPRACTLEKHQFGNGGSPVFNQFNTSFKSKFVVIFPIASIWWRNMTLHDQEMRVVWIYGCITLKEIFMLRPIRRQIRRSRRCTERNPLRGVPYNRPGVVTYSISSVHFFKKHLFLPKGRILVGGNFVLFDKRSCSLSFLPTISFVSVSDPWRAFWAEMAPFKAALSPSTFLLKLRYKVCRVGFSNSF